MGVLLLLNPPWFTVSGIALEGTENTVPYVTGQGTLWATGSYVWNPPGDDFPVTLYSSDVSGICSSGASPEPQVLNGPSEPRDDQSGSSVPTR